MKKNYTGTSGFNYPSWRNIFYPEKLPASKWLSYYATQFNTLELNSTFYKFPVLKNLVKMFHSTPDDFIFSVKAHKRITHTLRLKNAKATITEFTSIAEEGLGNKLGCILFQLPPSYKFSEENLRRIIESIKPESRNIIEFRNSSWWTEEVIRTLTEVNLTFCNVSYPGLPETSILTSEIFYLRMHGIPELFKSFYDNDLLSATVKKIPHTSKKRFIYFNNTTFEAGFLNALTLKSLL